MNIKALTCAIAAISMSVSGVAFAQNDKDVRADRAARGSYDVPSVRDGRVRGPDRQVPARDAYRGDHRGDHRDDRRDDRREARGAGPEHNFYRGGRLPAQWRSRQYVVDDWRGHHLSAPPRGYHWVQTGGDYVLVAIATGVIASILLSQ